MKESKQIHWEKEQIEWIYEHLNTSKKGLTEVEAKKRLKIYGKNVIKKQKGVTLITIFFNQFKSPIAYILLFASALLLLLGESIDAGLIFFVFVINVIIGTTQEERSSKAFEKINKIRKHKAIVYRDYKLRSVESQNIVIKVTPFCFFYYIFSVYF